ncbi:MAG: hypothetical protein HDR03_03040 [Lachnospiraceae bacterium]|nr:hypothetical protein [Lachnospiraceae bacterium]
MGNWKWKIKLAEIKSNIKIKDRKYIITFLFVCVLSYFTHKIASFSISNDLDAIITLLLIIINVFIIDYINKMMEELKDKVPIPYLYLPDKYRELLYINAWLLISILLILVFVCLEWFSSILVVAVYWALDFWIRVNKIKKEQALYFEDRREKIVNIYAELSEKDKFVDLTQLLRNANGSCRPQDYESIIDLSCEFFLYYLDNEIKNEAGNGKEFGLEYESLYKKTYEYISNTYGELDTDASLPDFIFHMSELLGTVYYKKYLSETILATIIAFSFFEKNEDERQDFIKQINNKLKSNSNSKIDGNFIRNILFLCLEFSFQNNKNKGSMKLNINNDITKMYESEFKHDVDVRLYYFLWLMWTNDNKKKLSENIINFYEFIEYCKDNKKYNLITDEQRICKTQSLYILIKEVQPEQEIRL